MKYKSGSSRAQKYQWSIVETVCPTEMLEAFSNEESVYKRLNPFDYNDEISQLEEQLKKEFWRVVDASLTERQKQVLRLYADGYTQMEIAKILNVNQSSVTKSINGNVDYKKDHKVSYGGSRRKLRKIIENDEKIKEILRKMADLRGESWI